MAVLTQTFTDAGAMQKLALLAGTAAVIGFLGLLALYVSLVPTILTVWHENQLV